MNEPQAPTNPINQVAPVPPKQPLVSPWLLVTFIIVLLGGGGYLGWYFWNQSQSKTTTETPVTTTTTPTATTTTPTNNSATTKPAATTASALDYTNSTYGFTVTFPTGWEGYKMKEANIAGATMTYYINIPTKDTAATGDSTAEAGYYSPFAISVYTLAQWAAVETSEGPKDTLITKNTTYAFGWSQANGIPASDFTKSSDIATIIASFKLK